MASCPHGGPTRTFNIVAIQVPIVYNKAGEHDPNGLMYVLAEDETRVREAIRDRPFDPVPEARPLVVRCLRGEVVRFRFTNKLRVPASIHLNGLSYRVQSSDGTAAGFNANSVVRPGRTKVYSYYADTEGPWLFNDLGNPVSGETGSNLHGLWGALIVEKPGSRWTDPETGNPLTSGLYADIHHPSDPHFREYVVFFQDEMELRPRPGPPALGKLKSPGISYRTEPDRIRDQGPCPGEDCMMSSWAHGDPATPILHGYAGDPFRINLIHAGTKETHVFHLHVHEWGLWPDDPNSTLIDAVTIGPQQNHVIVPNGGLGSIQHAFGDIIFHCHLYPHFAAGMWGLMRSHDVREDGTRAYPDGTPVAKLVPLPDRTPPPPPTPSRPGYPNFIPGTVGFRPPQPPLNVVGGRAPTPLEAANFAPNWVAGALFSNPAPPGAPLKIYDLVAIQLDLVYNNAGWHDPEGRIYVLAEDEADVRSGAKPAEPLVIRANVGDVVEIRLTNKLPLFLGGNKFQSVHETLSCTAHVHFVKFDPVSADGGANGWNYYSGALQGETFIYRWYCDKELRTIFFHDHLWANLHQQHGLFAFIVVEPEGSTYHDPYTSAPIRSGTNAVVKHPTNPDFREFCLQVHDFAFLFDTQGHEINPPSAPDLPEDPGVMGFNYKCEPLQFRPGDPAHVFSSYVHGDPVTPLFEAYSGDPVRIRLYDGAHEEQHSFNLHGCKWPAEPTQVKSPLVSQQTLGISEAFNLEFTGEVYGDSDLLYYSGGVDDVWLGVWGIMRVYAQAMPHLPKLDDRPDPTQRTVPFPPASGSTPPPATDPGDPCPPWAPVRHYHVSAIARDIVYNGYGDHDPTGMLFVLDEDEADVVAGRKTPKPLVIRCNEGDCLCLHLTNHLPATLPPTVYPEVPVPAPYPPSNRISLHASLLRYDARGSDGATIGYNFDQTAGPGETITYRWYADREYGTVPLVDMADIRNHRHRGAFAVLVVEPVASTYRDPYTGRPCHCGQRADVINPYQPDFREFVVVAHNGVYLLDKNGNIIPELPPPAGRPDKEDQGQKAFNYRSESFRNRLARDPRRRYLFSSFVHGDPATPIFRAHRGDPVVVRYAMVADKPRNTAFTIHGHMWRAHPGNPFSRIVGSTGALSVGAARNFYLEGGAGGHGGQRGDYIYRSGILEWDLEQGMWGLFRIRRRDGSIIKRLPDRIRHHSRH